MHWSPALRSLCKLTVIPPDIGLPSANEETGTTKLPSLPRSSPSPKLITSYQEAHRSLLTDLYSEYKVRPARFFDRGRVFIAVSPQPPDSIAFPLKNTYGSTWPYHHGEEGTPKMQRFIVIREGERGCHVLPISTFGGQGVAKQGVTCHHTRWQSRASYT